MIPGTNLNGSPAPIPGSVYADEVGAAEYEDLRRLPARYLQGERPDHTLQATALVHEAFVRVLKRNAGTWQNREHLIAFAAKAMRRILISYGVSRTRLKRGGPEAVRLPLSEALQFAQERALRLEEVDEVLEKLELLDPRQAQIVEMRFFAGLTIEEIASALRISPA